MQYLEHGMGDTSGGRVREHACLYVVRGPCAGTLYEVRRRTVVGREPSCDIVLPDESVSREHAMFIDDGTTLTIADVASTNGTLVNGTMIEGPTALTVGDRISLGPVEFEFVERRRQSELPAYRETRPDITGDAFRGVGQYSARPRETTKRLAMATKRTSSADS